MPFICSVSGNLSPIGRNRRPFNLATGGNSVDVPNYGGTNQIWRVHTFNSPGTLNVLSQLDSFRILVVGGGGFSGGGQSGGGGGGALQNLNATLPPGNNSVTVGSAGQSSSFAGLNALAGGNGGAAGAPGGNGACGGGGGRIQQQDNPFGPGGGTGSQGFNGSFGTGDNGGNGGGGGGGGMGSNARPSNYIGEFGWNLKGGGGGSGLIDNITGTSIEYSPGGSGWGLSGSQPRLGTWGGPGSGGGIEGSAQPGIVIIAYRIA